MGFKNFYPADPALPSYFAGPESLGHERPLNRIDPYTGKARDFFRVWELEKPTVFRGAVTIDDGIPTEKKKALLSMIKSALAITDILCGAACRLEVEGNRKEIEELVEPAGVTNGDEDIERLAAESAENIRERVQKSGASATQLRVLADAVYGLRKHHRSQIADLPGGLIQDGEKKGHYLWDGPLNARSELDKARHALSKDEHMRGFCERLGQALYSMAKEKRPNQPPREILGRKEYFQDPNPSPERRLLPEWQGNWAEWIVTGRLRAESPFYFGTGSQEGSLTDMPIVLDTNNRFRLPRSVLRGALRRDLGIASGGRGCVAELGPRHPCICPVCRILRDTTIRDMLCSEEMPDEVRHWAPDIRQRVRINPLSSTAAEGALFNQEVGPEGITFPFVLRYRGHLDHFPEELQNVLEWWQDEGFFAGGTQGTGKGLFRLEDVVHYQWPLKGEKLHKYVANIGYRGNENRLSKGYECDVPRSGKVPPPWQKVSLCLSFEGPVLVNDPIRALLPPEDSENASEQNASPNAVFFKKTVIVKNKAGRYGDQKVFALKSESVRGLFRSAVGQDQGLLVRDHEDCDCVLCRLFGNVYEEGKVRFHDFVPTQPDTPPEKLMDHVSIDRFSGGAVEKFNDRPLVGSPNRSLQFKGDIWIHNSLEEDSDLISAIENVVCDIQGGLHVMGGKSGIGYGWIKGMKADPKPQSKWLQKLFADKEIDNKEGEPSDQDRTMGHALGQLPEVKLESDKRYYPHYFLPPYSPKTAPVHREQAPVRHDQFDPELFSGTIRCTLTTVSPLIIPDTEENDAYALNQNAKGHKSHRFFSLNGETMIPGAPLRAMISSVYEAVTNSCYRVLNQKEHISRRMAAEPSVLTEYQPGRIVVGLGKGMLIKKMKSYRLPLYDQSDSTLLKKRAEAFADANPAKKDKIQAAAAVNQQIAKAAAKNREFLRSCSKDELLNIMSGVKPVPFTSRKAGGYNPNDEIATLSDQGSVHKGYIKLAGPNNANVQNTEQMDSGYKEAWIKDPLQFTLNDVNLRISNKKEYPRPVLVCIKDGKEYSISKRCERVFEQEDEKPLPVSERNKRHYKQILGTYANRNDIDPAFQTRFSSGSGSLEEGDLVYFKEGKDENGEPSIDSIIPVIISREVDSEAIGEKLPFNLRPCARVCLEDCDSCEATDCNIPIYREGSAGMGLCPACRLFGTQTYKGRVSFGFACHAGEDCGGSMWARQNGPDGRITEYVTLPLLERPRPTWVLLTTDERIPGRKFYVHHKGWQHILEGFAPGEEGNTRISANTNNASFQALEPGQTFTFEIKIKNLHQWELGLLLYCLELEPGLAHKLGHGKPLGFGSVQVRVDEVRRRLSSKSWEIWNGQSLEAKNTELQQCEISGSG